MPISSKTFILLILLFQALNSQLRVNVGISQGFNRDFLVGEQQNFDFLSNIDLKKNFKIDTGTLALVLRSNIGYVYRKQNNESFIFPTDNNLFSEGSFIYPVSSFLNPFVSANLSSGPVVSFMLIGNKVVQTGKFRDPITTFQNLGLSFSKFDKEYDFILKLGFSLRQVRADKFTQSTDNFQTKEIIEKYRAFEGISFRSEYRVKLDSVTAYRGFIDVFRSTERNDKWLLKFENELTSTVLQVFAFTLRADLIFDENQSKLLQYKLLLRFGYLVNVDI